MLYIFSQQTLEFVTSNWEGGGGGGGVGGWKGLGYAWIVGHWNAKNLLPKFQKLPPKFPDIFT